MNARNEQVRPNGSRVLPPRVVLESDDGLTVCRVQHDSQETWLTYWYRLGSTVFDVRDVPGYTDCGRQAGGEMVEWAVAQQRHHAEIIRQALNGGWRPEADPRQPTNQQGA